MIQRVSELPDLTELLNFSQAEGDVFIQRLCDDFTSGTNRFDRPGEAMFVGNVDGRVVAICGLNIDPYLNDPGVGRVRHLYVLPTFRGRGIGGELLNQIVAAAQGQFHTLRIRTSNPMADALYRSAGFARVDDPSATHIKGQ